jgi:Flp pilus assembly protein TadG
LLFGRQAAILIKAAKEVGDGFMGKHLQHLKKEHGQGMVEAALTIPLFLLILCGIIDFGWIYTNQLMLNNSSREAARFAVVNGGKSDFTALVTQKAKDEIAIGDPLEVTVTITKSGNDVTVLVEKTVPVFTPVVSVFTGKQVALKASNTMRMG